MARTVPGNPWLKIWIEPKKTIRTIVSTDSRFGLFILAAIYGLPLAFNFAQSFSLSSAVPVWAIVIGSLIVCMFLGLLGISISAWLLQWTGRWIGGRGNYQSVRAAVAWSNVPNIATIIMWVVLLGAFGGQVFNKNFSQMHFIGYQAGILFLVMLIESIASIWGFIILINTLAEVQGFSIWRALLNVLIPFVSIVVIIWIVGWMMWGTGAINQ